MSILLYGLIFAVLMGSTALELVIISLAISTPVVTISIIGLAGVKAILIALFFQHLKDEPKVLSSLLIMGLIAAIVFASIILSQ